ncbi:MAG: c-type cytochrome [Spirosomataceae bacterium]
MAQNWTSRYEDLNKLSDLPLVELQKSPSDWHARRARVILQHRATKTSLDKNALAQLQTIFEQNSNADHRLRAMWTLHITNNLTNETLQKSLNDTDAYIRAWAIQLLCEDKNPPAEALALFVKMAKEDASPVVRLYLAAAMQRIDNEHSWKIAENLVTHSEDFEDHNLPKMIWFGLEPLVKSNPSRALALASKAKIPLIAKYVARRLIDDNNPDVVLSTLAKFQRLSKTTTINLLEGMRDGLEGRYDLKSPANWPTIYNQLRQQKGDIAALALQIAQRFGDTEITQKSIVTLKNKNAPIVQRQQALVAISSRKREELVAEFPALLNEPKIRIDAIRAIAEYDKEPLAKLLIANYQDFTTAEKLQAIQTLSSRPKYGWQLTQAIKNQTIPKRDVPAYSARQLLRVVGSGFIEVWGPIEQEPSLEKSYAKYQRMITDKAILAANATKGKAVFQNTCGSCHKMYGEGGNIGPDLTGSNRGNIDYLLFNVLNPSGEIQEDYKLVVVTTRDGRTYSGNIVSENERQLTMRIVGQEATVINKSAIQSREVMPTSLMPVGLFDALSETEILDLVKYMSTVGEAKQAKK